MIVVGLAIELVAGVVLAIGLALGEATATVPLWASIGLAVVGLAATCVGVARARPPRRALLVASQQIPQQPVDDRYESERPRRGSSERRLW